MINARLARSKALESYKQDLTEWIRSAAEEGRLEVSLDVTYMEPDFIHELAEWLREHGYYVKLQEYRLPTLFPDHFIPKERLVIRW